MKRTSRPRPPLDVVRLDDNLDVRYWTQEFGVSHDALQLAMQVVGTNAEDLRRFVHRARGRCSVLARSLKTGQPIDASRGVGNATGEVAASRPVSRLQYVSRSAAGLTTADLPAILSWSLGFNAESGISGVLLFTGNHFTQVLEGEFDVVQRLMASIRCDSRHRDIRMISQLAASNRTFTNWSMAMVEDFGLDNLVSDLWWARKVESPRAEQLVQHLLHRLRGLSMAR